MPEEWVAYHEAGHAVAARALRRRIRLLTAEAGERWAGVCSFSPPRPVRAAVPSMDAPFVAWPSGYRDALTSDTVIGLAGEIAEWLFLPRTTGRAADPPGTAEAAERALQRAERLAAAPEAAADERRTAAELVNSQSATDAERVDHLVFVAFGADWQRGLCWRAWLEQETAELLRANADAVKRLAALLMARGVVGEKAAAAALRGVSR